MDQDAKFSKSALLCSEGSSPSHHERQKELELVRVEEMGLRDCRDLSPKASPKKRFLAHPPVIFPLESSSTNIFSFRKWHIMKPGHCLETPGDRDGAVELLLLKGKQAVVSLSSATASTETETCLGFSISGRY